MTPAHLHILQHALGLNEYGLYKGKREGYRNYFSADCDHYVQCRALADMGLMVEHEARGIGPYSTFVVTAVGRGAVREHSPPAPKLTRAQKRYQRFLDHDCDMSFIEWLRVPA